VALRVDERVASTLGVNVTGYKLLAFTVGGFIAGIGGGLFAHFNGFVQAEDFTLLRSFNPIIWVLMAVVGGLGSRAGIIIGSSFFALLPLVVQQIAGSASLSIFGRQVLVQTLSPVLGAILLLVTITLYPGGIGQQLLPIRRWLAGGPFLTHRRRGRRPPPAGARVPSQAAAASRHPEAVAETAPLEPVKSNPEAPSSRQRRRR
jgi:branched-chain amino acid transport system permease protein